MGKLSIKNLGGQLARVERTRMSKINNNRRVLSEMFLYWLIFTLSSLLAGILMHRVDFNNLWIAILTPTLLILWIWFPIKSVRHPRSIWKYYKDEMWDIREIQRFYLCILAIFGAILGIFVI